MASYKIFEYLPYVEYQIPSYSKDKDSSETQNLLMTHILRRIRFTDKVRNLQGFWETYIVGDDETPLDVAWKAYGSQELYWVILLFNDIYDPFTDWVMNQKNLAEYIEEKYGDAADDIHHYELGNNIVQEPEEYDDLTNSGLSYHTVEIIGLDEYVHEPVAVTNRQWEQWVNESKRRIKIPDKNLIPRIVDEAYRMLNK